MQLAALRHDGTTDIDTLLQHTVERLRADGWRVRGLLMHWPDGAVACGAMDLLDIETGQAYRVSQDLGPLSRGCRADPQGFARAASVLHRALQESPPPELVVINRFGSQEAEGGGLRAELLALLSAGVPVLTAVSDKHLAAWEAFSGGVERLSPPDLPAWLAGLTRASGR